MFCARFFCTRFFAPRFFPKLGADAQVFGQTTTYLSPLTQPTR